MARVFLNRDDDHRNCIYLTDEVLIVRIKNRNNEYALEHIQRLNWEQKKLIVPIVVGGLMSSFSTIAYMNDFLHPLLLLSLFIGGIFLTYFGLEGLNALTVILVKSQEHYFVKKTEHVMEFVRFFNSFLRNKSSFSYYTTIGTNLWGHVQSSGKLLVKEKLALETKKPVSHPERVILRLDHINFPNLIYYLKNDQGQLKPYVIKDVPLEAVTRVD